LYSLDEWQNPTNEFAESAVLQVHRESGALYATRSSYVLLVIFGTPYGPHQYLFFIRTGGTCRYIGHVDAWDKYKQPQYRLVPRQARGTFFVIDLYGGSGTGFYRENEYWYAVDDNQVRFVLGYPLRGHEGPAGDVPTSFEFSASSDYRRAGGREQIDVLIRAQYTGMVSGSEGPYSVVDLFSTRREAWFVWRPAQQRFILDKTGEASSAYLDWLPREWNDQGFLENHTRELAEIARNGTAEQNIWLRKLLDSTVGPQTDTLKAMLSAAK
jgi:hypothetical protein